MADQKPDRTFEDLWNEAYIAYLKMRQKFNIPLTEDQKLRLKNYEGKS